MMLRTSNGDRTWDTHSRNQSISQLLIPKFRLKTAKNLKENKQY